VINKQRKFPPKFKAIEVSVIGPSGSLQTGPRPIHGFIGLGAGLKSALALVRLVGKH
jgi:hypothetical protein